MSSNKLNNINFSLSRHDTMLIKGLAICLMLWHHLFYMHPEYGGFVYRTGQIGKVCVAIFLFVSGYGLAFSYKKQYVSNPNNYIGTVRFLTRRFVKFYANYWVIFFIFVPMGIFLGGRSLQDAYGSTVNNYKWLFYDFLGVAGFKSYNITWWFNKLIICLYLLFPFLFVLLKRWTLQILLLLLLLQRYHQIEIPVVHDWLLPFGLGIACALNVERISRFLGSFDRRIIFVISLILILLFAWLRKGVIPHWSGIRLDGFLTIGIVLFAIVLIRNFPWINRVLRYLGRHSMNMYMIHTFVFFYWFETFIYSFQYPILIFAILTIITLCISILIESMKTKLGVYSLINRIENKLFA